jgi:hypothetical protein
MHRTYGEQLLDQPRRAHINRRAIALTGHLLMAGIWLEHRLMSAPRPGSRRIATTERRALSTLVVRTNDTPVDPTRIEEQ